MQLLGFFGVSVLSCFLFYVDYPWASLIPQITETHTHSIPRLNPSLKSMTSRYALETLRYIR